MKKITLIFSLMVAMFTTAMAQTYTMNISTTLLQETNETGSKGQGVTFNATEDASLEFCLTQKKTTDEVGEPLYFISLVNGEPKIVDTEFINEVYAAKYQDFTITAPEGRLITACSISFVSSYRKATATVQIGEDVKTTASESEIETVSANYSEPISSIEFTYKSENEQNRAGYGIFITGISITLDGGNAEGGETEGGETEGEGNENQGGNEGEGEIEGGDNQGGNEGEGNEEEGEDIIDRGEGNENQGGNEGETEGEGNENQGGNEGETEGGVTEGEGNEGNEDIEGGKEEGDNEGEEASIDEVTVETAKVIYDLTGRRVNEITKAGIYIVNGKKVVIK